MNHTNTLKRGSSLLITALFALGLFAGIGGLLPTQASAANSETLVEINSLTGPETFNNWTYDGAGRLTIKADGVTLSGANTDLSILVDGSFSVTLDGCTAKRMSTALNATLSLSLAGINVLNNPSGSGLLQQVSGGGAPGGVIIQNVDDSAPGSLSVTGSSIGIYVYGSGGLTLNGVIITATGGSLQGVNSEGPLTVAGGSLTASTSGNLGGILVVGAATFSGASVKATGTSVGLWVDSLTMYGGTLEASGTTGIFTIQSGGISINGGYVIAKGTWDVQATVFNSSAAIKASNGDLSISGGSVQANGGLMADGKVIIEPNACVILSNTAQVKPAAVNPAGDLLLPTTATIPAPAGSLANTIHYIDANNDWLVFPCSAPISGPFCSWLPQGSSLRAFFTELSGTFSPYNGFIPAGGSGTLRPVFDSDVNDSSISLPQTITMNKEFTISATATAPTDGPYLLDIRVVPTIASVNPTAKFSLQPDGTYAASMTIPEPGTYTLTITYEYQRWGPDSAGVFGWQTVDFSDEPVEFHPPFTRTLQFTVGAPTPGDSSTPFLWVSLLGVSALAIAAVFLIRRRNTIAEK